MASFSRVHEQETFMTCILSVNYQTPRWQKAVRGVLRSSSGVHSFKMDGSGLVEVSGTVDPHRLIEKLGKAGRSVQVCWFQFGQCSNNLFLPSYQHHNHGGNGRNFPFRDGGGQCYSWGSYGNDHDRVVYLPPVIRRGDERAWDEPVCCCSVM